MFNRVHRATVIVCALASSVAPHAQTVPPQAGTSSHVAPLPLSGRSGQPGAVVNVQNPLPAGLQSVNTITSTVQVQGAYQGSVPSAAAPGASISLTLDDAVRRGL